MNRRLGSVPYLNARPLVAWFTETEAGRNSGFEIVEETPSVLARMLEAGEIECGLLSSVELFRADYGYVPGIGISADGPVESVRLFSRVPTEQIRTVALDTSSKTSVALTRLILEKRYGLDPEYRYSAPDAETMLRAADAALLIGDVGFNDTDVARSVLDLGTEWKEWTGFPFVYALWIGKPGLLDTALVDAVTQAKQWGEERLDELADRHAFRHWTTPERARHYLNDVMVFDLDARYSRGLARFRELVEENALQTGTLPSEKTSV